MTAGDAAPEVPVPLLRLGDREFRCKAHVPTWVVMKLSSAYGSDDAFRKFGAAYDFLAYAIDGEDWSSFETYAADADLDFAALDSAIGDVLVEMGGRGKDSGESSGPSSGGSSTPVTPPTSRVVSLSKGTATESPAPLSGDEMSSTG